MVEAVKKVEAVKPRRLSRIAQAWRSYTVRV
jgi:hypothetical protein